LTVATLENAHEEKKCSCLSNLAVVLIFLVTPTLNHTKSGKESGGTETISNGKNDLDMDKMLTPSFDFVKIEP
jgi:hypothetical protein